MLFGEEHCFVVNMSSSQETCKNVIIVELFSNILIHALILCFDFILLYSQKNLASLNCYHSPDLKQNIHLFCLPFLSPSVFRSFPAFPI